MSKISIQITSKIILFLIINLISYIICDVNIHIIPHTHLDPGWLKTPEEYYNDEQIEFIYNTMLNELTMNQARTFVVNEIYYFKIWYSNLKEEEKNKFKNLLNEKRVEFVSGSYIINDEANALYYNIADQIRIGHQFLLEEFGIIPKTAWYIDSFGHSAGNAHILAQFNFENLVLGRMHTDFLELMKNELKTEFYWDPFGNKNSRKKILTHVLPLHYGFALFFNDLDSRNDNFQNRLKNILEQLMKHLKEAYTGLRHNNIMFLFGDDFKYKDNNLFLNIDSIINAFNNNQNSDISIEKLKNILGTNENIKVFYSTPEKYFDSVKNELKQNNKELETYTHIDFYPYRSDCFWTGFFTSRPYLKGFIKKSSNIFYSFSKYFSFKKLSNNENMNINIISSLNKLREEVALSQHHDAITGTCKQYVSEDYINRLQKRIKDIKKQFITNFENTYKIKIEKICVNNYISDDTNCFEKFYYNGNENEIKLGIYNPKFSSSNSFGTNNLLINIEIDNAEKEYKIEGIKSDFFCIDGKNIDDPKLFKYQNKCFLHFFYQFEENEEIIFITLKESSKNLKKEEQKIFKLDTEKDEKIELIKDDINIQSLTFFPKNFEFNLEYYNEDEKINSISFTYYDGMYYVNAGTCKDGAYIFSPYNKYPDEIEIDYKNSFYYKGELGITFVTRNKMASFTIFTIFFNPFFVKVEHIFDKLENSYFLKRFSFGYSFILKTNINNLDNDKKPIFYTDANGLEMMKRTIDKFEFKEKGTPWTGGNFYPVTSFISIQDENIEENKNQNKNKVTIFNDRAQGGTGYEPGSIILILQRMSYEADDRGLTENMYENESMNSDNFKTTHLIVFGTNIYKSKEYNKYSNDKYILQKTDLINFVYNYLNTATMIFKIKEFNNGTNFNDLANINNDLKSNSIHKFINISPDIRANYELINNNLVIGEYFRYNNYFFNKDNNDKKDDNFGKISINFNNNSKFKIYLDSTGINYNIIKQNIFNDEIRNKLVSPENQILNLNYNELLYIYFYLQN